ncbi:hypothetical protein FOCC_FOCC016658 [Frankliniella occidentalis]|nr:hypothetical protein FOCC_FOCC016658 [Frankliniella occidentalis]
MSIMRPSSTLTVRPLLFSCVQLLHQGLARQSVYWPGISQDIESFVRDCYVCAKFAPAQKRLPLLPHQIPDLPYQQIACDILDFKGQPYLCVIDSYSKWLDVIAMSNKNSESVVKALEYLFSIHGIPQIVLADNMPFKSHVCTQFANDNNFQFVTCSPHHHQSNGLAERACGIARQFLNKCSEDPSANLLTCLLQYRVTPIPDLGVSPSQMLMNRLLRTKLPIKTALLEPCIPDIKNNLFYQQQKMAQYYNRTANNKEINYSIGDYVYTRNVLTNEWEPAIVVDICDEPRSYMVQTNGNPLRRNTTFIKPRSNINELNSNPAVSSHMLYDLVFKNNEVQPAVNQIIDPVVIVPNQRPQRNRRPPDRLNL